MGVVKNLLVKSLLFIQCQWNWMFIRNQGVLKFLLTTLLILPLS